MPPPLRQREPTEDTDINEVDFPEFDKKIGHAPRQLLTGTCGHPTLYHIQCGFPNSTKEECHNLGCCYTSLSTCYHSLPSEHQYQSVQSEWRNGTLLTPTRNQTPYHKPASPKIFIHLRVLNQSRIQLTLDTTANQPDTTSSDQPISTVNAGDLQAKIYSPTFFVEVSNVTAGEIIFSTARGPLVVTENFFEWTLHLGVDSMFGLGEAVLEPGRKYLLFNSQNASAVPAVMGYNLQSQQYNGVVFTTPGLTEIEIVRSRLIVVRSQFTGSFQLELLSGPSPADLHRQLKTINQNQYRPPFWAYGVHVCDHARNASVKTVREDIQRLINSGVMFDSHCINDDLFWLSDPPAIGGELEQTILLLKGRISFIGTPICGNARDNVTEELCIRWYQFGSLLPLFKVSSDRTANRFSKFAERIMHATIRNRFALIEYFNSLIVTDSAYLRPMFYHYEEARNYTAELWEQFMIGDSLLVVPVLLPQMTQIDIYFPEKFYELWAGEELPQTKDRPLSYTVVESDLPIFIRPGRIVALREVLAELISVDDVRLQPMHLIGALSCPRATSCTSTGSLVFVEGFEVRFHANLNEVFELYSDINTK
ncbi:neutral alpha-glucosidase ab [Culex quinquefasciatus]|uniref:Neutral alpha-glucosidase ab n=1 Tax=Culex quinquefasciatus TaxID=7176 RepID=B0W298_CULQU|nr:neutral alpha-glucosidase ab [Culex quinquefasciatus]|eukprot:XP_001842870.1 neutral alpha-glucosidase ab [Culex quinquefasciatus]